MRARVCVRLCPGESTIQGGARHPSRYEFHLFRQTKRKNTVNLAVAFTCLPRPNSYPRARARR